jgi:hypothetical protein
VLEMGGVATMVFQMPPIGPHPDHDRMAYSDMARIADVNSCIYVPEKQPSHIGSWPAENRNGHTDCHAPLIYLDATKKTAN